MSTFDRREEAFESKFAHDEELRFKAVARRNKLLGLWAAEKLGLGADKAQDYAKEVVRADFEERGRRGRVPQDPQGFRRCRRRPVGSSDPPDHGRAAASGGRAGPERRLRRHEGAAPRRCPFRVSPHDRSGPRKLRAATRRTRLRVLPTSPFRKTRHDRFQALACRPPSCRRNRDHRLVHPGRAGSGGAAGPLGLRRGDARHAARRP